MKLCITIGTTDAFSGALIVFKGLDENLKTISELGYDGIELALYKKQNIEVPKLKQQLKQYNLKLPVISTGQIFTMQKAWFTHPDKYVREKAVDIFKGIIEVASEFGADVNVSRVRGHVHEEDSYQEAIKRLTDCMEKICTYASKYNIRIILEQMNRYETNYMFSAAEVGEYIKKTGISNLKIHADVFHMNIEDVSITDSIEEYGDLLGYIHFADSNRLAPGWGHTDFSAILCSLKKVEYEGWIGIEVLTKPDAYAAAKQAIDFLKKMI